MPTTRWWKATVRVKRPEKGSRNLAPRTASRLSALAKTGAHHLFACILFRCGQVHITNCCANSDDPAAFAGEIAIPNLADSAPFPGIARADNTETTRVTAAGGVGLSLAGAFGDIQRILAALVSAAAPFLEAQPSATHLEYIG